MPNRGLETTQPALQSAHIMPDNSDNIVQIPSSFNRCAGPNCGILKGASDRWWVMWSSFENEIPVMHLAPWNENLAVQEGALHVCGEGCAQKLQSQFMGNVLANQLRRTKSNG
jgi:hypothetical protein